MKGTRFSQEKIIGILKEAECKTSTVGELCRKHGGLSVNESRRLKDLEKENFHPKRLLAERDIEIDVMKEQLSKN